MDNKGKTLGT